MRVELLERTGEQWGIVETGSMVPMIDPGDRVLVEAICGIQARIGDIAVFQRQNELVLHRIIGRTRQPADGFVEKGDGNLVAGSVSLDAVIGRVREVAKPRSRLRPTRGWQRVVQVAIAWLEWLATRLQGGQLTNTRSAQSIPRGLVSLCCKKGSRWIHRLARTLTRTYISLCVWPRPGAGSEGA
ncbi:MAG: S26 family signal peptidase [Acidobacteriota bacterium]|nr:MAG: S26 family signal peptidase [Acidobacteriota bacterium]